MLLFSLPCWVVDISTLFFYVYGHIFSLIWELLIYTFTVYFFKLGYLHFTVDFWKSFLQSW
jgi:hypothetical protein